MCRASDYLSPWLAELNGLLLSFEVGASCLASCSLFDIGPLPLSFQGIKVRGVSVYRRLSDLACRSPYDMTGRERVPLHRLAAVMSGGASAHMDSSGAVEPLLRSVAGRAAMGSYDLPVPALASSHVVHSDVQTVHSARKRSSLPHSRSIRFSPAVQFWFPGPNQICRVRPIPSAAPLPRPSSAASSSCISGEHVGLRSLLCRLATPCRKGGPRSPAESARVSFEDLAQRALESCAVEHVGFRSLSTASSFAVPPSGEVSAPVFAAAEHVGIRSLPTATQSHCMHDPLRVSLPVLLPWRSGLQDALLQDAPAFNPYAVSSDDCAAASDGFGPDSLSAATSTVAPFRPALSQPLGISAASAVSSNVTVGPCPLPQGFPVPFTSFDEVNGPRTLRGDPNWAIEVFIREALDTAGLSGSPVARALQYEVVSLASPQIALTRDRGKDFRRAVVFDASPFLGHLEVVDVAPGTTTLQVLPVLTYKCLRFSQLGAFLVM